MVVLLYYALSYIRRPRKRYAVHGAAVTLALTLVLANMGVAMLVVFFGSLMTVDAVRSNPGRRHNRRLYAGLAALVLAAALAFYAALFLPLPHYILGQSFPIEQSSRVDVSSSTAKTLKILWQTLAANTTKDTGRLLVTLLLGLGLAQIALSWKKGLFSSEEKQHLPLVFGIVAAFIVFGLHEFLASGVFYRLFWAFPMVLLLMFLIFFYGTKTISGGAVRYLIYLTLLILSLTNIYANTTLVMKTRSPYHLLKFGNTRVFLGQNYRWIRTVVQASRYLQDHTAPGERILVLPFDALYYFLSGRDGANRQLIFFYHKKIMPAQERSIIADLEKYRVRYILISNRSNSPHEKLGIFGVTYCPLLAGYIQKHFRPVARYGDWNIPCGWAWNHAVLIYQRKD
jgi:hypothetical protein